MRDPKLERLTTQLPPATVAQLERVRSRGGVAGARPPLAAVARAAIEAGLPVMLAQLGADGPSAPPEAA